MSVATPDDARPRRPRGMPFDQCYDIDEKGCHVWRYALTAGYGASTDPSTGKSKRAHQYAWEQINGPLPKGMSLHHTCDNKACCNPDCLQLMTPTEHARVHGDRVTHCPAGHEYTPENTRIMTWGNGRRQCRKCHKIRNDLHRKKHPEQQAEWCAKNPDYQAQWRAKKREERRDDK